MILQQPPRDVEATTTTIQRLGSEDRRIVSTLCEPSKVDNVITVLEKFCTDKLLAKYPSKEEFFKHAVRRILKSKVVGKSSHEVFGSAETYLHIRRLLVKVGARGDDVDEIAQESVLKFLRLNYVERFNPLVSSWGHYLRHGVNNSYYSHKTKCSRKKRQGYSLERMRKENPQFEPELNVDTTVYEQITATEALQDFVAYVRKLPAYRKVKPQPTRWIAMLKPPGTRECPVTIPREGYVVRLNEHTLRVTDPENGSTYLFPKNLIREVRQVPVPVMPDDTNIEDHYPYEILTGLLNGAHIDELVANLHVGQSTIRTWIHQLEVTFHRWWSHSDYVDESLRWMGTARVCPGCGAIVKKLPPLERLPAQLIRVGYRDHFHYDPEGCEVDGRWCPHCTDWSVCKVDPGMALRSYLRGQYPWANPKTGRKNP